MTSRMSGRGCVGLRRGAVAGLFLALAFTAGAASAGDNAAFVSYSGVPQTMKPNQTATVTVTMRNTGTTTWRTTVVTETRGSIRRTTRTTYSLDAVGHGWGVNGVPVSGSVAPNATRRFQFTIRAPAAAGSYTFRWRMSRNRVVTSRPTIASGTPGTSFGATTPSRTIYVGRDTAPSFGSKTIANQEWLRGKAIDAVTLPAATGGNGPLSYALTGCHLPRGMTMNRTTRRLSGTPRTAWGPTTCTWKVTDADDNTAASDADTLDFTIRVRRPVLTVSPTSLTVEEGESGTFDVQPTMRPTGTVTVELSSGNTDVADVDKTSLTFTATNYGAKTVTVTGAEDDDASDESTSVSLSASGGGYNSVSASVNVTVEDDDTPALVVDPTSVSVDEGGTGSFTVALATQPTATVTVSLTSGDTEIATVPAVPLTFTAANYGTAQRVTVSGSDRQDADASDESTTVNLRASGGDYGGVSASVDVTLIDPDTPALVVDPTSVSVDEGGTGSFTVALATKPTGSVTVSLTSGDSEIATVNPARLTFTAANYSTSRTVTVSGSDRQDADASDESTTVELRASGGDYGGVSASVDVTLIDPDTPALVVDPTSVSVDEGSTGSFTVALATKPTGTVTVSLRSGDTEIATVDVARLTFTAANYGTSQTVTVTGVDDADASDESTSVTLGASGGDYGSESASVAVTVDDDDRRGLVVIPSELTADENGTGSFTAALATQPTGTVTVSVTSGDTGAATVSPASLSFSTANYGTSQTVTVTGVQDADASNEDATVSLAASGGDYGSVSSSVSVTVTDDDTRGLVLSATELDVDEGGTGTFTVALSTQPTGAVTVSVSSGDTGTATVSPASLSFSTANYGTSQTVTVTGVQDADASNEDATVSLSASGGDYGNVSSSVDVDVEDDDTQGLALSATELDVTEGGNGTFTVALSTQPTGAVTVSVSSGNTGAATVSPASLSFTGANYGTSQTVTVTGVQDDDASNEDATVNLSASGGDYGNVSSSVDVDVEDDDTQGLVLSARDLSVAEGGNSTFTVALSTQPTGTVIVSVTSGDTEAATVSPASLSFTASNYGTSQTVTVTGVQDADASNESATVSLSASGGDYGSVSSSVSVAVTDDDARGLVLSATDLSVAEGGTGTFTVALSTQPTGTVTVSVTSGDTGAATVSPASLSFTTANYGTSQTVTVTGVQDADASNEDATVSLAASGGDYGSVSSSVSVTVTDDDTRGLVLSATDLSVAEGGTGTFTVALSTQPTGTVTVSVTSGDTGAATVSPASLSFSTANYGTSQTVTVTGVQDADASNEDATVSLAASGGDYGSVSSSVSVTVTDDDTRGLVLSATELDVDEGGTGTFTVALSTQPTGAVTVTVSSGDTGAATVSPTSLSFSTANYGASQTVTVTGVQDADASNEDATVSLSASGGDYGNVSSSVDVGVEDDDTQGLALSATELDVSEGGTGTFTVALSTQPTGAVTVSVSSGDTGAATASPASLSFTASNYSTSQTVTVTGVQDADASNESASVSLGASGGDYGSVSSSVSVTVTDDDTQGLVLSTTDLSLAEGGNGTFTVALATQPTGAVTVTVTSGDTGAATVSPASLSFTAADYGTSQTVTVTGVQDADSSNETASVSLSASGGDYGNVSSSVDVDVEDDDTQGLVLSARDLSVAEGGTGTFTVALSTQPTGAVTVSVSSGDTGAATVSPASLSFTAADYGTSQTVTVTGVQDADSSNESASVSLAASGGDYSGVSSSVSVTVTDDDAQGLVLSATDLSVAEGGTGTFTVALSTQPTGSVTVTVSSGDTGAATVSPASLSFTTANYGTSQTVTVTGVQDGDSSNESASVSLAASGGDYGGVSSSVSVTVTDDDAQGLVLSATDLSVAEGGNGTFTVALSTQPTGAVSVTVSSGDTGAATVSPTSLSFTTANYGTSQTVTVTGVQDDDSSNESASVSLAASGGDYGGVSSSVSVTVTDDDAQGLVLSATELDVTEGGTGTFTVALSTQPTGAVTVTVSSGDTGAATVSPASLSFTAADYGTSQTVTVTGVQDDDSSNESASVSLSASGGDYGSVSSSVSVTVTDDDAQGLVLSATELDVTEGGTGTFTVALSTQPTGAVTVSVSSGDTGAATASPASLSFTAADYGTSQTVTVTGVQDADSSNESTSVSLSASGGDYGSVSSSVSVTVTDDDAQDTAPSFGSSTILDQTWVKNTAIGTVTLPDATGGDGTLTYSLSGTLPPGVTFNSTTRVLSGTPTSKQAAVTHTYTATDADGDTATLSFTIRVEGKSSDGASFVSYADVPSSMAAGSSATVTVRMRNAGTTTWTQAAGYRLGSQRPENNTTWGLSRVSLPSDTAPNATVDFTFRITAPTTVGSHKFRWRMLRGESGWFGGKTTTVGIAVEADVSPSFGEARIPARTWVKNVAIAPLTLPAASGGNGRLTYSVTGTLPPGVTFDSSTRVLSGTPTKKQAATTYTYTATDADGDTATLSFTIRVDGKASDGASFVSYVDVPSTMAAGSSATVTVRMRNAGSTTWTSGAGYKLGSQRPQNNTRWGLSRVALASDVAPNATADFTFTITAPTTVGNHNFRWRMLRGTDGWFGDKTTLQSIAVEADVSPSFGSSTILDKTWVKNVAIAGAALPAATGGNGTLTYSLTGTLPRGVAFDSSTRVLSGTPTKKQAATTYSYTATDSDGDTATISFTIRVDGKASDGASFVSYADVPSKMVAGGTATVTVRMKNTGTTTWTSAAGYKLGSQRPEDNTTWGLSRVSLASDVAPNATGNFTFTITAPTTTGNHNFRWRMLTGTNGWFGDKTTLQAIAVEDPSFGDATVADQAWTAGTPIEAVTLPAANGTGGALTYSLTPSLPAGVTFTESTRTLAGTPSAAQAETWYTYKATDPGDDAATLSFRIRVTAAPRDDAAFVSYSGVPSKIHAGGTATVTVRMRNTGTTTWTSSGGYRLGSQSPGDNTRWGSSRISPPSDVAPNAEADFTFTITAPETTGGHAFAWRMVRDAATWFGASTTSETITVEHPSFGDASVADQAWTQDTAIATLTLPTASGGDGTLTYSLTPTPPAGVTFDASARTLSGTPTATQAAQSYTYTATDSDSDTATLTFEIRVAAAPRDDAAFVSSTGVPSKIVAGGTATVTVRMRNTGTTTWTSSGGYKLGSQSPADNTTWGSSRIALPSDVVPNAEADFTFTITAPETTGDHAFAWRMVRDPSSWFGAATTSATITVEDPSFGDAAVADQSWVKDTAITALTLPEASGGDGTLTYSLTPSPPAGVTFTASTRTLSGTPTATQAATTYSYAATDSNGDAATLSFSIAVVQASSSAASASALPPPAPAGVFDMFEYWLPPRGAGAAVRARLGDGRTTPAGSGFHVRSFWRGDLWGRKVALLGDPGGARYDIFEEVEDGLDYWGTYEGASGGGRDRPSSSLDRPFRWMNRFMGPGEAVESAVTGHLLSGRGRNREGVFEATMRLEIVSHLKSFAVPGGDGLAFEDVLEVRFWPDAGRSEVYDTFHLARGFGAVHYRRPAVAAPGEVVEWWAVEKALRPVGPYAPSMPWFDPFSPGWPKTAVLNGNLEDAGNGPEGAPIGRLGVPGWTADSGDAVLARPPSGLDAGAWSLRLRGSDGGGDNEPDVALTEGWIPVQGGTYQLSACMRRESAGDNVLVDFDDGKGRDADFADAHLVATSTGSWECRAVTKCIPGSVGAVRVRAARDGANLGDAWFDRIELKRIAACTEQPGSSPP